MNPWWKTANREKSRQKNSDSGEVPVIPHYMHDPNRTLELGASSTLSLASIGSGVFASVQDFPFAGAAAIMGPIGAVVIQIARLWYDDKVSKLRAAAERADVIKEAMASQIEDLIERDSRQMDRINHLVAQRDSEVARTERVLGMLLTHAGDVPAHVSAKVAEAAVSTGMPPNNSTHSPDAELP
jgi:hypothetical protein